MIVILEGADGVGKTTAAQMLRSELRRQNKPVISHHRGPPKRDPLLEYTADLEHSSDWLWHICDRWHWGELIYGPLYRGKSLLSGAAHQAVDEFLARHGAIVIHIDLPTRLVEERVAERGDDYVKPEHLGFILQEYRRIRELASPLQRRTIVDFNQTDVESVIHEAKLAHERI